jgi:uncharacterized repeat protein (TIGR01451 family)
VFGNLAGAGTCSVPQTIPVGGTYTCSVTEFVGGVQGFDHRNVVTVTGEDDDGATVTDTDDAVVEIGAPLEADVQIVKTASVASASAGTSYDWTLEVTNLGPEIAAEGVVVTDLVPGPATITKVTSAQFDCSFSGLTVTCTKASMAVGERGTITVSVSVPATAESVTVTNVGAVDSDTPDPDLTNNADDASVEIVELEQKAPVSPPPVTLPRTGGSPRSPLTAASLLILAGLGMVLVAARRRTITPGR